MDVQGNNSYLHITALSAGAAVKSGPGTLHSVNINTKGTAANTLTLYDGTSTAGAVIAVIDTTANVASIPYDIQFLVGLFYVCATGGAGDITISWH